MVYIKRVELSNFKSFGGTTAIPFLPGFTVVSGPNGSGKSNILDALLFALGLSSSKGMRADRLPDLVNNNQSQRRTVETSVTVTFDLEGENRESGIGNRESGEEKDKGDNDEHPTPNSLPNQQSTINNQQSSEWTITRKLRVTAQGSYTSNYYLNGESCTLTELHEKLNDLRVYPEGYNVVLQGDVTSIISMNARERREIIDELAGVAAFDRKIVQAKRTLEEVKETEDKCRIVEAELVSQRDRLSQDRIKAEKYQKLRAELQEKTIWAAVIKWRQLRAQKWQLQEQIALGDRQQSEIATQLTHIKQEIEVSSQKLEQLNTLVKSLGEEELLKVQSTLANQEAELRQQQRQQQELENAIAQHQTYIRQTQPEIDSYEQKLQEIASSAQIQGNLILNLRQARDSAKQKLETTKEQGNAIASASEAWVQQQTALSRQIETLLQQIEPQRTEQAQLAERHAQLTQKISEQTQLLEFSTPELFAKEVYEGDLSRQLTAITQQVQSLAATIATQEAQLKTHQETQKRLLLEQRDKQRQLDKLEAQAQAQQEAQGTNATITIKEARIQGVCGLVAQLGTVEPRYQLALEIAAGARLANLVVESDVVAAEAIQLLKQKRAGRVTFLPLNKIRPPRFNPNAALNHTRGFVDYAVNLIDYESRYQDVFSYIFGNTVVFEALEPARSYLGEYRIVTLDGELLETSGAMTGGSISQRSSLHFGTGDLAESEEARTLRERLGEIEVILEKSTEQIETISQEDRRLSQDLAEARGQYRESELQLQQTQKEIASITSQQTQVRSQLEQNQKNFALSQHRLQTIETELPALENQLQSCRIELKELEDTQTTEEWQKIRLIIQTQEAQLQEIEQQLKAAQLQQKEAQNQQQRLQDQIDRAREQIATRDRQQIEQEEQLNLNSAQQLELIAEIKEIQAGLKELEQRLGQEKQERDRQEQTWRSLTQTHQEQEWKLEKLKETLIHQKEQLTTLEAELVAQTEELPDPIPEVPEAIEKEKLSSLEEQMRSLAKRLQAMEPVNMLALEEYERTTTRLTELTDKLATIAAERTELLLRIENFRTLRFQAFKEAFDAVNENFKTIFAELSEGDGFLQLEDPEDPFNGGLNLVAHPKGKPIQRLASMSGGEKSLTALSFIFALQRYRPSPFYAFDEVDMFLDGANVERLARMIEKQAQQAQFIVVSLRRPMIESSERTIGVTQARGAYTQVLGLKLSKAAK
ncbi:chromosome segregation protein SMC [Merismopedia glauca]|uniref:Chromosome partition protein Smc n=1 Tax=Merismopedia glauca CCAP 1448/3 TaxID=1296344 RepID=A0A2T1CAF4_9CYAN|nr:chromosome segregation protein SMC [Merismopedia glauca]PSB05255.1 chromosome segregation protein SMC [Merismopedia glauca CCAP 1448/3]